MSQPHTKQTDCRLAYPFDEAMRQISKSRAAGYRACAAGDLKFYMDGRRRMVTHEDLLGYVELLKKRTVTAGQVAPQRRRRRRAGGAA
jgi:hypothetical protein